MRRRRGKRRLTSRPSSFSPDTVVLEASLFILVETADSVVRGKENEAKSS
jgi:hypothetical protein